MCRIYISSTILFIFYLFSQIPSTISNYPIILPGFVGSTTSSSSLKILSDTKILVQNFSSNLPNYEFRIAQHGQIGEEVHFDVSKRALNRSHIIQDILIEIPKGKNISDYYSLGVWTEADGFLMEVKLYPEKETEEFKYIPCPNAKSNDCKYNSLLPIQPPVLQRKKTIPYASKFSFKADLDTQLKCTKLVPLFPHEFKLISDGELWILDVDNSTITDTYLKGFYCLKSICSTHAERTVRVLTALACEDGKFLQTFFHYTEIIFLILSAIVISITFVIVVVDRSTTLYPKILLNGYLLATTAYILFCLITIFIKHGQTCTTFMLLFQYLSLIAWMFNCLSLVDTYYLVRYVDRNLYSKRSYLYFFSILIFSLLLIALNKLLPFSTGDFTHNDNCFMKSSRVYILYILPILIFIPISVILSYLIHDRLKKLQISAQHNFHHRINKFKKQFGCFRLVFILMVISYVAELITIFYGQMTGALEALNFIRCFHGIFIFLIFVYYDKRMYGNLQKMFNRYFRPHANLNQFQAGRDLLENN